jgi:hypothetical protein
MGLAQKFYKQNLAGTECPAKAITLKEYPDEQVAAQIGEQSA